MGALAGAIIILASCGQGGKPLPNQETAEAVLFQITAEKGVNVRQSPTGDSPVVDVILPGGMRDVVAVEVGQEYVPGSGNVTWYRLAGGGYVYSGLVQEVKQ